MNYNNLTKRELLGILKEKDIFIDSFIKEKEETELLSYAWTQNLGHWYWNVQTNIVKFNSLKATQLGYKKNEIPKDCGHEFFTEKLHPEDYEPVMQNMREHLLGKASVYEVEYRIRTKEGTYKWYYDRGKITQYDENGKPLLLVGIVFDISPQKQVEKKQRVLIRELSKQMEIQENMFMIIFHDLKNSMSGAFNFVQLLDEEVNKRNMEPELKDYTNIILEKSQKSFDIMNTLLNWAKLKKYDQFVKEEVDLLMVIEEILTEFAFQLKDKEIKILLNLPKKRTVKASHAILLIAIRNILLNAIKFTQRMGQISISFSENILTIKDNGIGMDKEKLGELFTATITPQVGTNNEKGSGIGLLLVKKLLNQIDVKINVKSQLKKGTSVELIFNNK